MDIELTGSRAKTVSRSTDHVVRSGHDADISIVIDYPGILCLVVAWKIRQVLRDEAFVIVVEGGESAGRVRIECLTACKALSHVNAKGKGIDSRGLGFLGCFSLDKERKESKE